MKITRVIRLVKGYHQLTWLSDRIRAQNERGISDFDIAARGGRFNDERIEKVLTKFKRICFSNKTKAIYIRLVDMKCPLVVVILIYTHLMQVC